MKKPRRKRSKPKIKVALGLSIIAILAVSSVAFILLYNPSNGNSNGNGSQSSDNSPDQTANNGQTTPGQTFANKTVNKQIPSGYTMGFPVDAGLLNGMNVVFIRDSNEKVSIRFTAKLSGTVTKLVTDAFAYEGQPVVLAGIQEDVGGYPSGSWLSGNGVATVLLSSSSGFKTFQLQAGVSITKGRVYHIVIEAAGNQFDGVAAFVTYQADGFAQPFNLEDPDLVWSDSRMTTLAYAGGSWMEEGKMPIFVVGYADGSLEGQPYSISAPWVVWGSTYVGQMLIPASDYKVGRVAFDVSFKSVQPSDKLYYQIRDMGNTILSEGVFAEPSDLTAAQKWVEVSLSVPVTLRAGQLYRIVLLSPQTSLDNAYHVYGHEFSYDPAIGYGGVQHQITSSLDAGVLWGENSDADAIFKLTTSG